MLYNKYPYDVETSYRDLQKQMNDKPIIYENIYNAPNAVDFLTKCLEHDMRQRMTPTQALQHIFLL